MVAGQGGQGGEEKGEMFTNHLQTVMTSGRLCQANQSSQLRKAGIDEFLNEWSI